jgi:hypothetical protein
MELKIGVEVCDRITGFRGIITGKTEYISGCVQWLVKPKLDKDGKDVPGLWIDTVQLEVVGNGVNVEPIKGTPGGPRSDAPPTAYRG